MVDIVVVEEVGSTIVVQEVAAASVIEVVGVGPQGPSGTIAVGSVSTGPAGSSASVTNAGTSTNAIFDFVIPKGETGDVTPEAAAAKVAAQAAATSAAGSASSAASSATAAASSATSAASGATSAASSASSSASSASTATTKALEASTSAANAAAGATSSAASAASAATKASEASTSASNAAASATAASNKAAEATASAATASSAAASTAGSVTAAANSATSSAASATSAADSASIATAAVTTATAKAGESSVSAAQAAASAAAAASSASTAVSGGIRYDTAQTLTPTEKTQARSNLGLAAVASSGNYADLIGSPVLASGSKITGDFTSATRAVVQTSTANSSTNFSLLPNGTAVNAQFNVWGNSDPTNAPLGVFVINSTSVRLQSAAAGTGTILPLSFWIGASEAARFDPTTRNLLVGTTTDNGVHKLQVNGGVSATQFNGSAAGLTGLRTINGNNILGSGDITISVAVAAITSSDVTTALGFTPENAAKRNAVNGYAGLDGSGLIPSTLLPSYVDDVLEYANLAGFPGTGTAGKIYVALDSNKTYRWSGSTYVEISASPGTTDALTEGSVNLYFTNARAQFALSGMYLPIGGGSLTGSLDFSGTGRRITGDFSNATIANRVLVQTSTANANTVFGIIPNGTAVNAQLHVYGNSDPTNAPLGTLTVNSATVRLQSSASGTGTTLPLTFWQGTSEAARFDVATSNFLIGSTTDNGNGDKLQVNGSGRFSGQAGASSFRAYGSGLVLNMLGSGDTSMYGAFANGTGSLVIGRDDSAGTQWGASYANAIWGTGAYPLLFGVNAGEAFRLDPTTRNLLLGTTTDNGTDKLQVAGSAYFSNASQTRTNLGLAIGTNVQAWDADLDAIAAIVGTTGFLKKTAANTWALDTNAYLTSAVTTISFGSTGLTPSTNTTGVVTVAGTLVLANGGTGATTASAARTNLGLVIGTNVQAWDADLDAIAALAGTTGLLKKTAANTWTLDTTAYLTSAVTSLSFGSTGLTPSTGTNGIITVGGTLALASGGTGATTASSARTNLGLAIGTNVQAWDADLDAISALAGTSGILTKTGAGAWSLDTNSYLPLSGGTMTGTLSVKAVTETVYALSGTAISAANGGIQTKAITAATTFTDSLTAGQNVILMLTGGSSFAVTWPTMTWVRSVGNVAPSLTASDTIVLWKVGTTLYGAYVGSGA